ncbi:DUF4003 family protein [uncultured Clostridium sp.]|uniref:DUF4003 family protein n=1 Tax=uncultured Clostridium sp. TaxID=59620 RepID=UPI0025D8B7E2|nr:DUF4003 family protein [uncultured Clostridium sp.]
MDIELRGKVDLLTENYREVRRYFRWDGKKLNILEALLYSRTGQDVEFFKVKEIRNFIKSDKANKNVFNRRFLNRFSLLYDVNKDYKKEYENIKNVYEFLISKGFDENEDTVLSAFVLVKRYTGLELQNRVNKLIDIKNNYKKDKSIDYTLLATLDKDIQKIKSEVDKIKYFINRIDRKDKELFNTLIVQLMLDDREVSENIDRISRIVDEIEKRIIPVSNNLFPMIGVTNLIVEDIDGFIKELEYVYNEMKNRKIFKYFLSKDIKLMFSMAIILDKYLEEIRADLIDLNEEAEINTLLILEECIVFSICS